VILLASLCSAAVFFWTTFVLAFSIHLENSTETAIVVANHPAVGRFLHGIRTKISIFCHCIGRCEDEEIATIFLVVLTGLGRVSPNSVIGTDHRLTVGRCTS
jgi:hypothetical protein